LIIAVPDDALVTVACLLHQSGWEDGIVIHTSGVNGTEVLDCLAAEGSSVAALHPLQTVPSPEKGQTSLVGCQYVLTGDGEAAQWAKEIVQVLHGRLLELPNESRRLYHAAAVLICNDLVVLLEAGLRLLNEAGVERETATKAFRSLAEQSVSNVLSMKRSEALTGPVSRGDVGTIEAHLDALRERSGTDLSQIETIYRVLGLYAVRLAEEQGLSETRVRALTTLLESERQPER